MMVLFRLRDFVDKVLREEQCGFRKRRVCVNQIFALKLKFEKCLSFIDNEQAFYKI